MPPIQPIRPPGPPARPGRNIASKTPKPPKAPAVRVKPIDPNAQAQQNAMSAFRTALAQLQSSTPAVDASAIRAPYAASQQVAGQLGTGLQQAELNSGQAAQAQYGQALGQAQQQAAQFGISSGAGANQSALQNTGAAPLAQQTNAYAAAAPQAAAQWQQLLERTAAAKVSDAQLQRAQGLTSAEQGLATQLPTAIGNEKQLAFQKQTQRENMGLAYSQLSAKDRQFAQQYGLDALKTRLSAGAAAARTSATVDATTARTASSAASLAERTRHDKATEKGLATRAKRASASGVKGMPQVLAALKIAAPTSSSTKTVQGYYVGIVPGPNSVDAGANPRSIFVKDPTTAKIPVGWVRSGDPKPVTGPTTTTKTPSGMTRAQWDKAVGIYATYNGVSRSAAMKAVQSLTPRPKK